MNVYRVKSKLISTYQRWQTKIVLKRITYTHILLQEEPERPLQVVYTCYNRIHSISSSLISIATTPTRHFHDGSDMDRRPHPLSSTDSPTFHPHLQTPFHFQLNRISKLRSILIVLNMGIRTFATHQSKIASLQMPTGRRTSGSLALLSLLLPLFLLFMKHFTTVTNFLCYVQIINSFFGLSSFALSRTLIS